MIAKIIFGFIIAVLIFFSIDKILMMLNMNKSNKQEPFVSGNCPTTMIKKGDKISALQSGISKNTGSKSVDYGFFEKDYKEYVKWQQRNSGLNCPILHLEKVYDSKETNNTKSSVHLPVKIKIYKLVR